jgi:galactokinase
VVAVVATAPGRVNLIGDHTDHTGGLVLPMAIDLTTEVRGHRRAGAVQLRSADEPGEARVPLDVEDPADVGPPWARYVAGVVAELRPATGFEGSVTSTVPVGAGLSSSAALEVAVALALGATTDDPLALARLCQRAEQRASGVPCGIMDQLTSVAGVEGHALRIDCTTLDVEPVPVPDGVEVVVAHSGQARTLAGSAYAERAAACRAAEADLGPLPQASPAAVAALRDPVIRRRARHVVSENARVDAFARALRADDRHAMGELMAASHRSLAEDFEVSTPALDGLVERLVALPGAIGARLTGAGFGGCVVALVRRGAAVPGDIRHWRVRAAAGARVSST